MAPTTPDPQFVRKLSLLPAYFAGSIAYYRVGFVSEDGNYGRYEAHLTDTMIAFGRLVSNTPLKAHPRLGRET